jgi:hypothetical protein
MLKQDRPFSCETHMSSHVALISSAPTRQQGHIFGYFLGKKNYLVITLSKVKMKNLLFAYSCPRSDLRDRVKVVSNNLSESMPDK